MPDIGRHIQGGRQRYAHSRSTSARRRKGEKLYIRRSPGGISVSDCGVMFDHIVMGSEDVGENPQNGEIVSKEDNGV